MEISWLFHYTCHLPMYLIICEIITWNITCFFVNIYCTKQKRYIIIINSNYHLFIYRIIKLILCMIIFDGRLYDPCDISIPKTDIIDKEHFWYNCQSLNLVSEKSCVVNVKFNYFNNNGKLKLFIFRNNIACVNTK